MSTSPQLRIGELARRTGVATELLRAWERRYGLLAPTRTPAGYRLYSAGDVRRVGRMRELLASGLSAAEAARATLAEPEEERAAASPAASLPELREALERFDDAAAHALFDRLLAELTLDTVLDEVVLPLLRELGDRWAAGALTVAQEHFSSHLVRGRLLGLARGWDRGVGPRAVLACPPDERHDLGLLVFGLALREHGWRITFLGADTPVDTVADTVRTLRPAALVVAVADSARLPPVEQALRALSGETAVWLGGAGADEAAAERCGARLLDLAPLAAAEVVAA
jgi:MerR family transcriptional regulator, light-induced transcriptional regulator